MGCFKRVLKIDTFRFYWIANSCFWLKIQRWIRRCSILDFWIFPWLWLITVETTVLSVLKFFWQSLQFAVCFNSIANKFLILLPSNHSNIFLGLTFFLFSRDNTHYGKKWQLKIVEEYTKEKIRKTPKDLSLKWIAANNDVIYRRYSRSLI